MATKRGRQTFDAIPFLAKVDTGKSIVDYGADTIVFSQGDPAVDIFYIQKGKVKLTVLSTQGKEAVLAVLAAGDFFGEGCLSGPPRRMVTVTTLTECTVMRVTRIAMAGLLEREPKFSDMFISFLLRRNARSEEDLADQLFNSSEKRLARILLLLANFGKQEAPELIVPNVRQETLAEMVGTTRSRVNTFMNKFRRLGFIEYNGGVKVHSSLLKVVLRD